GLTMPPSHYDTLPPYAVALGVDKAWSNRLEVVRADARTADAQGQYHPAWYAATGARSCVRIAEIGDFSSSTASRIQNSLPSESDSYDSGASGSSGSGRGGGGVSGW